MTLVQTLAMTLWMLARAPGAIGAVLRAWRVTALVGLVGMLASFCWFAAFTLAPAAEVKAVGQVELLFSLATARLAFGERPSRREILGSCCSPAASCCWCWRARANAPSWG